MENMISRALFLGCYKSSNLQLGLRGLEFYFGYGLTELKGTVEHWLSYALY